MLSQNRGYTFAWPKEGVGESENLPQPIALHMQAPRHPHLHADPPTNPLLMKAVTLTVTFAGCLDGCPYAEGADRAMCPIFCTLSNRQVVGHSSKSSEIPAGTAHPPWCELPDREVDAGVRLAEVRACISCPHYAGIGDCGWPESRATGFSRRHLRAVDIETAHAGVPMDCPLPKAGRAER